MPITWRNVMAPNNSGANSLAAQGAQTIINGLGNLGKRLEAPIKEEEALRRAAEQQAFTRAMAIAGLDQGQQRITNTKKIAESAEEGRNKRHEDTIDQRDKELNSNQVFERELFGKKAAQAKELAIIDAYQDVMKAREKAAGKKKSKKDSVSGYASDFVKRFSGMSDKSKAFIGRLANQLDAGNYTQEQKRAVIDSAYTPGFIDTEPLTGFAGIGDTDTPSELNEYILKYFSNN